MCNYLKRFESYTAVYWVSDAGTQDIDPAAANHYELALPRPRAPINLRQTILDNGMGFFEVPALNRKQPSTSFKIRGRDFIIDVLAPMKGGETARPVHLTDFGTFASPLRYLDYLLDDLQPAVLLYEHGIMINVPAPGRFAIHKCVVSQRRPAALAAKASKDLSQAEQLFQVLLENRPSDIALAYDAANTDGDAFTQSIEDALNLVDKKIAHDVRALLAKHKS